MDSYEVTFQSWNNVAAVYQEYFMDLDLYNDTYDLFCQKIAKPNPNIFEIGCGPGNITNYLLSKRPDFQIKAIDIAPNMIALARKNNPAANFRIMDCREIHTLPSKFDGVMCGFCMPYLAEEDCAKLITNCNNLLNLGGIFYFSTIEGEYNKSGYETASNSNDKMYVYYYPEDYLKEKLTANSFEITELRRKNYQKRNGTISSHLIFIATKK